LFASGTMQKDLTMEILKEAILSAIDKIAAVSGENYSSWRIF